MAYSAALHTVYNHYLQTYSQTRPSRYDTHKKGELRSIYNSIVEQNRKSPLFFLNNSKETCEFAIGLKESARELRNTIASLGGLDEGEILKKKAAFSSDPDIVEVNFVGDSETIGSAPTFEIFVNQLATGQMNTGNMLKSDENIDLPVGFYSFDVSINETSFEFQFNVNEGEVNLDIQKRLSRLFKNADLGITAKIIGDDGRSALSLEANATGRVTNRDFQFVISDAKTSKATGSVAYLGLDNVTREAANAEFLLNGEPRAAYSNNFTVEKLFELNLVGVNDENSLPVQIGLKNSIESITENVSNLIDGYNRFLDNTSSIGDIHHRSQQIVREMRNIAWLYSDEMSEIGLTVDSDGKISIYDNEQLGQIITDSDETLANRPDGTLSEADEEDIESSNAGLETLKSFTNAILRKSNQITLNPMNYVDKTVIAYKNPARAFVNPYVPSAYSGMMFNGYC